MTHVTEINTGAFERLASFLEEHPEKHDQSSWIDDIDSLCSTTACIAGWAAIRETKDFEVVNGCYLPTPEAYAEWTGVTPSEVSRRDMMLQMAYRYSTWTRAYFFQRAKEVLGLSQLQAEHLFNSDHGPLHGLTVSEALHKIATGAAITDVWGCECCDDGMHWEEV